MTRAPTSIFIMAVTLVMAVGFTVLLADAVLSTAACEDIGGRMSNGECVSHIKKTDRLGQHE